MSAHSRIGCLLVCGLVSTQAHGQYETDSSNPFWVRALLDVRIVHAGPAASWTDHGPGKMRFGGSPDGSGFQSATRFALADLAIQFGATLPAGLTARAQVNIQPDIADNYRPWLFEAILRREWGDPDRGWGLQAGVMNPPFSLENRGPAWTPEFTISASTLNNWIGEDIELAGAEGEWWHTVSGFRFGALVGAGYGADQMGRIIALRGWVLGDTLGGINGSLAVPGRPDRSDTFNERDHRPAFYGWLSASDEDDRIGVKLGYMNNDGDQADNGVWSTHFTTVGLELHPQSHLDLLLQYLDGTARVHSPPNDSSLSAFYVLLSPHFGRQRLSVRYDVFRVHDLDGGPVSTSEHGDAVTAAYLVQLGLRHRFAFEYVWMNSHRVVSAPLNPTPDGWQFSYRFRY
jgi:hypothetical protein